MNRIYKVIYSKTKNAYIAVSELAKAHGKAGSAVRASLVGAVVFGALSIWGGHL